MDVDRISVNAPLAGAQESSSSTGVVDISDLTAEEVEEFVAESHPHAGDIRIQRRGGRTFLVATQS